MGVILNRYCHPFCTFLENWQISRRYIVHFPGLRCRSQNCDSVYHFVCSLLVRPLHIGVGLVAYLTVRVSLFPFCDINEASCGIYKVLRSM